MLEVIIQYDYIIVYGRVILRTCVIILISRDYIDCDPCASFTQRHVCPKDLLTGSENIKLDMHLYIINELCSDQLP